MVKGGFAYLLLTETMMIAALDPNGFRPLSIGQMNNGAYVVASETCALETVGARFIQDVAPGEVVIISDEGLKIEVFLRKSNRQFVQWNIFILHDQIQILLELMCIQLVKNGEELGNRKSSRS